MSQKTKAIILAAGTCGRLGALTADRPKCLLELRGQALIARQLMQLYRHEIQDVTVVTGYLGEKIHAFLKDRVEYRTYPHFSETNNLHTLYYCRDLLSGDLLILFSDVLTEDRALSSCLANRHDFALLVETSEVRPGTMRVRLDGGLVTDIGSHIPVSSGDGNFIGIAKYSARATALLKAEIEAAVRQRGFDEAYYTQVLPMIAQAGHLVNAVPLNGARWFEIDTIEDYERAQRETFYDAQPF